MQIGERQASLAGDIGQCGAPPALAVCEAKCRLDQAGFGVAGDGPVGLGALGRSFASRRHDASLAQAAPHAKPRGRTTYCANSRERRVAAATASRMRRPKPFSAINTSSAARVVPPGLVTA